MREKYVEFGEICAKICGVYAAYNMLHICGITKICSVNDACVCLRWTKCTEMLKNVIAYAEICEFLQIYV